MQSTGAGRLSAPPTEDAARPLPRGGCDAAQARQEQPPGGAERDDVASAARDDAAFSAARDDDAVQRVAHAIAAAGGWMPFDDYMAMVLHAPGFGYYARGAGQIGAWPAGGSDFVTAPEMSPLFGAALARQVRQALDATDADEVIEFGAGSGALAEQLLDALDAGEAANAADTAGRAARCVRYAIVELSAPLRERQAARLGRFGPRVRWLDRWPERIEGVVVANEVLDAMPVKLLHWDGRRWFERGVAFDAGRGRLDWADRPTALRPPPGAGAPAFVPGTVTEIHPQALGFVRSLADRLHRGAAFFLDYGFPEAEYYHPQRTRGTLMCHRAHRAEHGDRAPLEAPGSKDVTAHVDFSGVALAAQDAGLDVVGYTSQARFLVNCGLLDLLHGADARSVSQAQRLLGEHEMGELFKVIGLARGLGAGFDPVGFAAGDRTHTL